MASSHRIHEHARAGAFEQGQRRFLDKPDIDLVLPQGFQQIDAQGRELDCLGVDAGLLEQIERERVIGIAERRDADRPSLQILDPLNLARGLGRGHDREQREAAGDGEATDIGAGIGVGLDGDIESSGGVVDGACDQRLHGGVAAAGIDQLHVEPVRLEVAGRARDLVGHAAQKLAAIGKLDLLALRLGAGGACGRDDACNQGRPLEQRTPRYVTIGDASGGFIAAAHGSLQAEFQNIGKSVGGILTVQQRSPAERPCPDPVPRRRSSSDAAPTIRLRKMVSNA